MKLYTEEQVKDAFIKGFYTDNFSIPFSEGFAIKQTTDSYTREFMKSLTPIELPSDEEIEKEGEWLDNPLERINWKEGAKWMKKQILNQNK